MIETKNQSQPLVTVGILSYKRKQEIRKTIESVLNQNYGRLEILISDDASRDDSTNICKEYSQKDTRITFFEHSTNIGPYRNYEFLVNRAHGKYFMWMSDDDELKPNIINRYVDFLENNPEYNLVSGQIQYWKNGKLEFVEKNLTQESDYDLYRVLRFYCKVKRGAIFYGLMRTMDLRNVKFIKNKLAGDWHVVAHMAYLSKVKQLDFVSMNKTLGGFSTNWQKYAKIVGANKIASKFPFLAIGIDILKDVSSNAKIYGNERKVARIIIGLISCSSVWLRYLFLVYPKIIGGKIKRLLLPPHTNRHILSLIKFSNDKTG